MKTKLSQKEKSERREWIARLRSNHHRALETLRAPSCELSGLQIWRKLVRLEQLAHACSTAYCNGERIQIRWPIGQRDAEVNLREHDFAGLGSAAWEPCKTVILDRIRSIFGHIPPGVFVNTDARGHALKLDADKVKIPEGMQTDWGSDGILAAEITEENT